MKTLTLMILSSFMFSMAHAECPESLSEMNHDVRFSGKNLIAQCDTVIRHATLERTLSSPETGVVIIRRNSKRYTT